MIQLFLALLIVILIPLIPRMVPQKKTRMITDAEGKKVKQEVDLALGKSVRWIQISAGVVAAFLIFSTSYVIIDSNSIGHLKRIYIGKSMEPGQIIAFDGQKGPQAEILPPGFHFRLLLNVLYDVEESPVI